MSKKVIDIYDDIEEKAPVQKPMNPRTKKFLVYTVCIIAGLLIALGGILLFDAVISGAPTPEEAVANYQKAAMLYDVENMIEFSSDYNKIVLYGNRETSDRLLSSYLRKGYEGYTAKYNEDELVFKLNSILEYERGESKYELIMKRYNDKIPNGTDDIDKIAVVSMTIENSDGATTRDYLAVKCGMRWFYAFAGV